MTTEQGINMKQIPLTQGKFALVDDEDFEYLNQWKWCVSADNYAKRGVWIDGKVKCRYMHRLIMRINDRKVFIDHKDHNGLNNQKENLRLATHSQNSMNTTAQKQSVSKYLGVSLSKKNPWTAQIGFNGIQKYLGGFNNEIDAAKAYNEAAIKYHGEFANLNKV